MLSVVCMLYGVRCVCCLLCVLFVVCDMSFDVWCLGSVVCGVLFGVGLFVGCCVLAVECCLPFVVVCCLLFVVGSKMLVVGCWLVWCLLNVVC